MRRLLIMLTGLAAAPLQAQDDWVRFRWTAHDGTPRDLEFLRSAIVSEQGMVRIELRRERATVLAQDPTIAPETTPWTWAEVRLDCPERRWQMSRSGARDSEGRITLSGASRAWLTIQRATLAEALRERFCPAA